MEPELNEEFESIPDKATLHPSTIAKLVGVHVETVRRWVRSGKLPAYTFGGKHVIKGKDFKAFMKLSRVLTQDQKKVLGG
jgi:excisionase family DNA binding protein